MDEEEEYTTERYEGVKDSYNTLALRLDPTPVLEEIKRLLQRKTLYNADKQTFERPPNVKPMLDDAGIEEIMLKLKARISIDTVLTKINENKIREIVRETGEDIIEFVNFNDKAYNLSEQDWTGVYLLVKHKIDLFLHRAKDGTENELLARSFGYKENVHRNVSAKEEQEKQKGGFSFFSSGGAR